MRLNEVLAWCVTGQAAKVEKLEQKLKAARWKAVALEPKLPMQVLRRALRLEPDQMFTDVRDLHHKLQQACEILAELVHRDL